MNDYIKALVSSTALGGFLLLANYFGVERYEAAQADKSSEPSEYCIMVGKWKADEKRGIPSTERFGWPDYNGNYEQVCK